MDLNAILTLFAILLAPLITILISKALDRHKEKKDSKFWIFRTLMATRATSLSPDHIRALNMIDVTFYGKDKKSKAVLAAWKNYLDLLRKNTIEMSEEGLLQWGEKKEDLLIELLQKIAPCLNYEFDKSSIRNTSYFPRGFEEQENDLMLIRKGCVGLLKEGIAFPVKLKSDEQNEEDKQLVESLKRYINGKTIIKVKIEDK